MRISGKMRISGRMGQVEGNTHICHALCLVEVWYVTVDGDIDENAGDEN